MSYYYLATPYTGYPQGPTEGFRVACEQTAILIQAGIPVFSPIAHTHPVAIAGGLDPLDVPMWLKVDAPMMDAAKGLIICQMPGWDTSVGIAHEIAVFTAAGKPVIYMTPGVVPPVPAGG